MRWNRPARNSAFTSLNTAASGGLQGFKGIEMLRSLSLGGCEKFELTLRGSRWDRNSDALGRREK